MESLSEETIEEKVQKQMIPDNLKIEERKDGRWVEMGLA
jgi:hypothetical protein